MSRAIMIFCICVLADAGYYDCRIVIGNLSNKISKTPKNDKNSLKIYYLEKEIKSIEEYCIDNRINEIDLKKIHLKMKYDKNMAELNIQEEKLRNKKLTIENKYRKNLEKLKVLEDKIKSKQKIYEF